MDQKKLLKEVLGKPFISNDELLFYCPYCKHHKRKLSVNIEKNAFKCWVCDTYGMNIRRVIKRFGSFQQLKKWDQISGQEDISRFDDIFEKNYIPEVNQKISLPEEFDSQSSSLSLFKLLFSKPSSIFVFSIIIFSIS